MIWNPFSKGYFENPYPHLHACRDEKPIQKGILNEWMFFKYEDVSHILRSSEFNSSNLSNYFQEKEAYIFKDSEQSPYLAKVTKYWPMYLNGESHKFIRTTITKAFYSYDYETAINKSLEKLEKKYQGLMEFDLVNYFSDFVFHIVKDMLSISNYESLEKFKYYSNMLAISQDLFVPKQIYQKVNEAMLWGKKLYQNSGFKEKVTSAFLKENIDFNEDDINSILAISAMAAFETSKDNLANAISLVLEDQELIDTILKSKDINLIIEELFRVSSPLQYTIRINRKDFKYQNVDIKKGSKLFLCLASANRDPLVFDNPDKIDFSRNPNEHLAFGGGAHFCLGAPIARQELKIAIKPMIKFLSSFSIVDNNVQFAKQIFMRTVKSVKLKKNYD